MTIDVAVSHVTVPSSVAEAVRAERAAVEAQLERIAEIADNLHRRLGILAEVERVAAPLDEVVALDEPDPDRQMGGG